MSNIRFYVFFSVMSLFFIFVWQHIWFRLVVNLGLSDKALAIVSWFFIASLLFQIYRFFIFRSGDTSRALVFVAYFLMGLFVHLFCASVTKDLLLIIPYFRQYEVSISQACLALAVILNLWGVKTAFDGPVIRKTLVPTGKKELSGFKIVQISDLHVGPLIQKDYVSDVVSKINSLSPDIVVMTGDIGDGDANNYTNDLEPFKEIKTQYGTYYVPGNHEYYWNAGEWIKLVESKGVKALLNEGQQIGKLPLWLGGVTDLMDSQTSPQKAVEKNNSPENFKVLLAHQPKSVHKAYDAGFNLMLSGHTHWGQFFPFNLVVGFFHPYSKRLNIHNSKLYVYVNAGTGFWGPPLRLGVASEVTLISLTD